MTEGNVRALIAWLVALSTMIAVQAAAAPNPDAPVPDWYVRGITASMLDPSPEVAAQAFRFPRFEDALAAIDPAQRQPVLDALLRLTANRDVRVQQSATAALAVIKLDAAQRRTMLDAIVTLAASPDFKAKRTLATALAATATLSPAQRQMNLATLVKLAAMPDADLRQAVATALAAIKLDDLALRRVALDTLVNLARDTEFSVQVSVAPALGAIKLDDQSQRQTALETLVNLASNPANVAKSSVADALGAIELDDRSQRQTALETLVNLASNPDNAAKSSVADALGVIKLDDRAQRQTALETLVDLASNPDDLAKSSVADALGAIKLDDRSQRQTALDTLVKLAATPSEFVQQSVASTLAMFDADGAPQRQTVLDILVKLAASPNDYVRASVALTLAQINLYTVSQRQIVLDTLVKLAANTDTGVQQSVATALAAVKPNDAAQGETVYYVLFGLALNNDRSVQRSAAAALAAIKLDAAQRQTVLGSLVGFANSSFRFMDQPAALALAAIRWEGPTQRQAAFDALIKLATSLNGSVQLSVADGLAGIELDDAAQRQTVVDTLVRMAASLDVALQRSVAHALAETRLETPAQRQAVLDTLVKLAASPDDDVQQSVAEALLAQGPLGFPQLVHVLTSLHDHASEAPRWRALGWAFAGELPSRQPAAVLLTFVGRPSAIASEQQAKDPADAAAILGAFLAAWPQIEPASTLREEIAQQATRTVRAACPTADGSGAGVLQRAELEWLRTRAWVASWLGADDNTRCWRRHDRQVVESMQQALASTPRLGDYAAIFHDHLAADGAMPVAGESALGISGWIVFWTGFLVAFPHSGRVRAFYLFNEKARGALSLWFVPAILFLLPVLRRRMLLPFRDDLLADARLNLLDESDWFGNLDVQDRTRANRRITDAIPDVRGRTLLVGESGLGKTTFLRVLAKRSRRTLVFLNARSCEKGVEDAILQRVSSFQSADFFRGLIYSGDLVVIIDGLNEVNADVRAGIVAFANRPGKPNFLIATQPIEAFGTDRSPLVGVVSFVLQPLPRAEIAAFLKSRKARDDAAMPVHGAAYDAAVDRMLADALDVAPDDEDDVLQERAAGLHLLSNPMDLTYASELLARGQVPRPSQIVAQAFALARQRYRDNQNRDFPVARFAELAVKLRREDRNWLEAGEFPAEQDVLLDYKLLVSRQLKATAADKDEVTVQRFRHDKVMDVLMKPAFDGNTALQEELIDDPRFRGVYLLFAQAADRDVGRKLRDLLVSRAAQTGENALSNEFVRRYDLAARPRKPRRGS